MGLANNSGGIQPLTKLLKDMNAAELLNAISKRDLRSIDLTKAGLLVDAQQNEAMKKAFNDLALEVLTGENTDQDGFGYSQRSSLGTGIVDALEKGDFTTLDRFIGDKHAQTANENTLKAAEIIRDKLREHCIAGGMQMTSVYIPEPPEVTKSAVLTMQRQRDLRRHGPS